jgi:hypothetical protein
MKLYAMLSNLLISLYLSNYNLNIYIYYLLYIYYLSKYRIHIHIIKTSITLPPLIQKCVIFFHAYN